MAQEPPKNLKHNSTWHESMGHSKAEMKESRKRLIEKMNSAEAINPTGWNMYNQGAQTDQPVVVVQEQQAQEPPSLEHMSPEQRAEYALALQMELQRVTGVPVINSKPTITVTKIDNPAEIAEPIKRTRKAPKKKAKASVQPKKKVAAKSKQTPKKRK